MKAHRSLLCLAIVAAPLLCACDNNASPPATAASNGASQKPTLQPRSGGEVTFGVTTEPACFDPHNSSQQNAFLVIRNYVDSLIGKQADGSFAPWLAKSWSVSPDGREYTFILRDDVTFTDGTPFDGAAVKANLDYTKDPAHTANAAAFLEYYDRTEVIDPHQVRIVLSKPDSAMLESLSSVKLGFLSPKTLAAGGDLCQGGPNLVGTGPFIFNQYNRGQSARFVKNPDYHWPPAYAAHQGPAYLDAVTYRFLPEYAVRAGALSSGQVDLIEGVQPTDRALFEHAEGFQFLTGPSAETSFTLNLNYRQAPTDDVRVRRALRDGFDLAAIVNNIYLGTVPRAWSNIGPDNTGYNKALVNTWGNDVPGANKLLDEAGWTGRDAQGYRTRDGQRLRVEVGYPQTYVRDNRDLLIQQIQAAVRKNLGLDLDLRLISTGEWVKSTADGSWHIYPNTLNPSDTALSLRDVLGATGFLYRSVAQPDEQITGLINQARATSDLKQRQPILDQIQQRAVDQAFLIPLFAPNYQLAARDTLHGLSFEVQLDAPSNLYDVWSEDIKK
ncbi:ABC transporter substrate-binding protein [Pseudomonas sp. efr-133-TYG-103a]|uniref:ABC transporter substrate-binding protein n=1 Tax=Pseudomonas sp. efr-133-TYG-103a TaxID=3040308 RepID=UPI002553BEE7|nr:ABC transporter substrate-binding protein [Pseudomonas sp. efr-133-TYG-103a]